MAEISTCTFPIVAVSLCPVDQGKTSARLGKKRLFWIGAGIAAVILHLLLQQYPVIAEYGYGNTIYPVIRFCFTYTLGLLPIAGIDLVASGALVLLYFTGIRPVIRRTWSLASFVVGLLSTAGALIFLFQILWGFNYGRDGLDVRLGFPMTGLSREALEAEYVRATHELEDALAACDPDVLGMRTARAHERSVIPAMRQVIAEAGYHVTATPRVRVVRPKGILMRWNTAGIYLPFSGEGHVDAGMLPVQIPFTLAHEMAHGFGVTDEGDCNFLAYLACRNAADPAVRFAGVLTYWRYAASAYRRVFPEAFNSRYDQLPAVVRRILAEIHANDARYPDLFPKLRNAVYDSYLKTQGVHEGLLSYNRVVELAVAYHHGR